MRHFFYLVFVLFSNSKAYGQDKLLVTNYFNLPPIIGTAIEIGKEYTAKPNSAFDIAGGLVINSNHLKSYHKIGTFYDISQRSGLYLKISKKFLARKSYNKSGPYFGLFLNNGLGFEKGIYNPENIFSTVGAGEKVRKFSYVGGLGVSFGINPPQSKVFGIEPGFQIGITPFENQLDWSKYTPGMGRNILGLYIQGILKLRFQKRSS